MNSEELELSLRSEFENYLKSFRAEMREHAGELRKQFEAEIDKHRSQLDEAFQAYAARFESEHAFDEGFKASVVEHLRQARDEGAALTAAAMAEAAQMDQTPVAAAAPAEPANYSGLRDAINEISEQRSQSTILKSLVDHAANFAPRGAFFIIKNDHLVGWKVFGSNDAAENAVADIRFPVAADSVLGSAVNSLKTSDGSYGSHSEDNAFLEPLQYGHPDRMHAIPLVARGRGVAVLYADYGSNGTSVNVDALETLVRIAGLTVELLASSQSAKAENREMAPADFENAQQEARVETAPVEETHSEPQVETSGEWQEPSPVTETAGFEFTESTTESHDASPFNETAEPVTEVETVMASEPAASEERSAEVIFDAGDSMSEAPSFDAAPDMEPATVGGKKSKKSKEAPVDVDTAVTTARPAGRQVDLPIEVSDEERRPHNDARRFARLLVSEIKLYNEQRVTEGRQAGDLYQRLREAIDRSREMYDKRVQPPVAAKFDYFHYELVNALAEGDENCLGQGYPGATV